MNKKEIKMLKSVLIVMFQLMTFTIKSDYGWCLKEKF